MPKTSNRLQNLSDQYERETGKQGLLYVYAPEGRKRYVFGSGKTCLSYESAIKHMLALLAKARGQDNA